MVDSPHNTKSNENNALDGLINEAMTEISEKQFSFDRSFLIPAWLPYLVVVVLILSLIYKVPHFTDTHLNPPSHAFESGQRIGLLNVAENINAYYREHGKLPKKMPSSLSSVLKIEYEKLGADQYKLSMPTADGLLILSSHGTHEDIYIEPGSP
jgi:hypothetical protein